MAEAHKHLVYRMWLPAKEAEVDETRTDGHGGAFRLVQNYSDDPSTKDMMGLVEASGTLDFWDRPEEDIYSLGDGEPVAGG